MFSANPLVVLLNVVTIIFFARAIVSWFQVSYDSPFRPIVDGIHRITEPILEPIRRVLPPMAGFDFSVIIVILVIRVVLVPLANQAL